jgi:hypothetical protein
MPGPFFVPHVGAILHYLQQQKWVRYIDKSWRIR